ncbi:MAG: formate dehydrogenase subunit alpha, partial [Abditibacteriales bacterium]|nr:formate dehydrogenase subunit alpha [Abditibacteriales bacterium]MDW8365777.1 formate dehydrogenase subunit alpha [Abditibacteriales bacterium]
AAMRDDSSPVILVDHAACILCDRCLRACDDVQCNEVIGRMGKGFFTRIAFDDDRPMGQSTCVSCGECASVCPTGALIDKPLNVPACQPANAPTSLVDSVCPYCGVGCGITYHVQSNTILRVTGRRETHTEGRLCVKGRYGWDYTHHPQRLTVPLIRKPTHYPKQPLSADFPSYEEFRASLRSPEWNERIREVFREATWEEALDMAARRFMAIKHAHGSQALAGFGSAKVTNEEAYLFQKLIRQVFGTNNVDHCTRLCHASSVAALMEGIGSGAVSNIFQEALESDCILCIGTNTTENHPVAATYFKQAAKRGVKLIVLDPRRPALANHAWRYVRFKPGTDVALLNGMMHVLIREGLIDRQYIAQHTENFGALKATVRHYTPEFVERVTGVPRNVLEEIACTYGRAKNAMIFWGMGISQHTTGTDNARCLIALCLMTGHIGRRGNGLHPLRGQNNVQGASDVGLIPMVYPGYQSVEDPAVRAKFEQAWGVPLDPQRGLTVVEITNAALSGDIKAMLMMGENPFLSDPNVNKVRKALQALEFLCVQDIFLTETAEFADVILPAATAAEKEGTYVNTNRMVQLGRKALEPPGQAREDWRILVALANRMIAVEKELWGTDGEESPSVPIAPWRYTSPEDIWREIVSLTPIFDGITYDALQQRAVIWPHDEPVIFTDGFPRPGGKGKFVPAEWLPAKELPDEEYPFVLNTGRVLYHWHTGTMTRRTHVLDERAPEPYVEIHPADLAELGAHDGEMVRVRSRRGSVTLKAHATPKVARGNVFIPMHFKEACVNVLTIDALDPHGKIPEFKFCAVRVERIS